NGLPTAVRDEVQARCIRLEQAICRWIKQVFFQEVYNNFKPLLVDGFLAELEQYFPDSTTLDPVRLTFRRGMDSVQPADENSEDDPVVQLVTTISKRVLEDEKLRFQQKLTAVYQLTDSTSVELENRLIRYADEVFDRLLSLPPALKRRFPTYAL